MVTLTNKLLCQLLLHLGFERQDLVERNHRVWRHPDSSCTVLLPDNKTLDPPRPADLVGLKAHLSLQGHLEESDFDFFIAAEGRLPRLSEKR
jgi:hypothetical protein